jgi:hypothetical protein
MVLVGLEERMTYHAPDSGYTVARLKAPEERDLITRGYHEWSDQVDALYPRKRATKSISSFCTAVYLTTFCCIWTHLSTGSKMPTFI